MNTGQSSVVTVRAGSVAVEKSFEPDQFPVPAIAFVVRAERDAAGRIRIVDDLPEGVGPEDVGFHPDYGEEHWRVEEGRIVFEREFDPDEEYTTVYGLRENDLETVERFLKEPLVESESQAGAEPDLESEADRGTDTDRDSDPEVGILGDDSEQVVRDVISGAADTIPGLEDDEEVEPLDLDDPEGEGTDSDPAAESGDATIDLGSDAGGEEASEFDTGDVFPDSDEAEAVGERAADEPTPAADATVTDPDAAAVGAPSSSGDGSVAAALVEELRAGTVDESVERALRAELGAGASADAPDGQDRSDSTDARIESLQSEVADLRAYTDALESFLDENGDAQRLLADLREQIDELTARIDGVGERVSAVDDRLDAVDERVAGVDDRLAETADDVGSVTDRVDDLDEREGDLVARIDDLDDDLADLSDDVAALDDLDDDLDEVADDVRERLDDIEADIVEIESFRKRMANVFGGASEDTDADADAGDGES